jgi:4-diphosphocytidyl-2-C-methyl-D-erythritol kinase
VELIERAPAKVNLTLRVLARRPDGYHQIESLVAFADVADTLALDPGAEPGLEVGGPFAAACGPADDNLVGKAAARFASAFGSPPAGRFSLVKNLPAAAGLGGGSADAAAALRLLARLHGVAGNDPRLHEVARSVGADVPVCLDPRPRVMTGIGDILSAPVALPPLPALLVNPGVALATREVFAALDVAALPPAGPLIADEVPREPAALLRFLTTRGNDLQAAASGRQPVVADAVDLLRRSRGCLLARMSGSGATCFGIYHSDAHAAVIERALAHERPHWWVRRTVLGGEATRPAGGLHTP